MFRKGMFVSVIVLLLAMSWVGYGDSEVMNDSRLVFVKGGTFEMGDVFGEGSNNELPVHRVTLGDFYIAPYEVTVGEFRAFVDKTGFVTSAEAEKNPEEQLRIRGIIMERFQSGKVVDSEIVALTEEMLSYSGTFWWVPEKNNFGFSPDCNWRNPMFEQSENDPVVCVSWVDAVSYCNWLSEYEGLPVAYDLNTGDLLNENGRVTDDITKVRGYRLPTEAEWEFAARERGKKVRFGNGRDTARFDEINFDASRGDFPYLVRGEYRKKTVPVGSFPPNSLGLYDMSGNAWEWCGDYRTNYTDREEKNPYVTTGLKREMRGGRWGGDASSLRATNRSDFEPFNRCNNAGFRIARSAE